MTSYSRKLVEGKYGHGAIPVNPVRRYLRRNARLGTASAPFDWERGFSANVNIAIRDQGESFSCSGHAGAYFLEIQGQLNGIAEQLSAKSIYAPIAHRPGGGATVSSLETQIGAHGANLLSEVPDSMHEEDMEETSWETPQLTLGAMKRAGYVPVSVPIDMDAMAGAIREHGAIIWEIRGQNGQYPGWLSPTPKPPSKDNPNEIWTHFMCSYPRVAIRNGLETLEFLQSWGTDTGMQGHQFFTEEYVNSGYVIDCFTFVRDAAAPVQPNPLWEAVRLFFNGIFGSDGRTFRAAGGQSS